MDPRSSDSDAPRNGRAPRRNDGAPAMGERDRGRAHRWDPDTYLAFSDERGRPFEDLMSRVGAESPRCVVDLGAGPGTLTARLVERWPEARITAVDSSAQMVAKAAEVPGITAELADLRTWRAEQPVDVMIAHASLQWIPGHLELLPALIGKIADGGWFAMQVPGNFEEPSHAIRRDLAALPEYAPHLADVAVPSSHDAAAYLRALSALGCDVDAWETTYLHVLMGEDPVFRWVSGTGARPTLQALPDELRPGFEDEYRRRLREAYPADADGRVILPFRRIFAVAHKR